MPEISPTPPCERDELSVAMMADRLGLNRSRVHYLILRLGLRPSRVIGPLYLYSKQDLDALTIALESRKATRGAGGVPEIQC